MAQNSMVLVYCPCPSVDEAKRLGHKILDQRLAGCINILPGMVSLYDWQGAREEAEEAVLVAKTTMDAVADARALLQRDHPYEVPAILTLPLADVNVPYRDWLLERIG
jgi:periplasmic divalent cation tolerance protein